MPIKNFKGPRASAAKNTSENHITVRDYMTKDLITFAPEQSVLEVMNLLIKHRISGGPVVNENRKLIGIISESDCMNQIAESRYYNMPMSDMQVKDYMIKDVDTIDGDMDIFDAAKTFGNSNRRRFPIVDQGKLAGQISQKDILKAALQLNGQTWK